MNNKIILLIPILLFMLVVLTLFVSAADVTLVYNGSDVIQNDVVYVLLKNFTFSVPMNISNLTHLLSAGSGLTSTSRVDFYYTNGTIYSNEQSVTFDSLNRTHTNPDRRTKINAVLVYLKSSTPGQPINEDETYIFGNTVATSLVNQGASKAGPYVNLSTNSSVAGFSLANITYYIWNSDHSVFNQTAKNISGITSNYSTNQFNFPIGYFRWNALTCGNDSSNTVCAISTQNNSFFIGAEVNDLNYTLNAYEMFRENYTASITVYPGYTPTVGILNYDNTNNTATISSIGSNQFIISASKILELVSSLANNVLYFTFELNGTQLNTTTGTQTVNFTTLGICNTTNTIPFLNFTYANETASEEAVKAFASSSGITYYGDSSSINRTFSYSNSTEYFSHALCFQPSGETISTLIDWRYDNAESQLRTYQPSLTTLSSSVTNQVLYLLPTDEGQYVTFQIINSAEQSIEGATVTISSASFGVVGIGTTDSAGSVTFFLNPTAPYTVTVEKTGFATYSTSITPTQTSYTISLGGANTGVFDDLTRGISYTLGPVDKTLSNDTEYEFNLTLSSSFWDLDEFGFTLGNGTSVFTTNASSGSNSGTLRVLLNTGDNSSIIMNGWWAVDGNYSNFTTYWGVRDQSGTDYSIKNFFTNFSTFVSQGLFGLNGFGVGLLVFATIFIFVGIMSYRYGVTSPAALMSLVVGLVAFFDVGLGLIPKYIPAGNPIPHLATILVVTLFAGLFIREVRR